MSIASDVARIAGAKTMLIQKMKGAYPTPYDVSDADSLQELVALLDLGQGDTAPETYPEATLADQIERLTDVRDKLAEKMTASGDYSLTGDELLDQLVDLLNLDPYGFGTAIKFSSPNDFTLQVEDGTRHWSNTIQYRTLSQDWAAWDGTTTLASENGELYVRGSGNVYINSIQDSSSARWVLTGENISCDGNIENLLDYETVKAGGHPWMGAYCFSHLFLNNTALIKAPDLPAVALSNYCYYDMFCGTSITESPELPATVLATGCYSYMLSKSKIVKAPLLPAMELAESCYSSMFSGCWFLTEAPELPATVLAKDCYFYMFSSCSNLKTPPRLPAKNLADACYYGMFYGCSLLNSINYLPATVIKYHCYTKMYAGTIINIAKTSDATHTYSWSLSHVSANTLFAGAVDGMLPGPVYTPSRTATYYVSNPKIV